MSDLKTLIAREIRVKEPTIVGTVIRRREMKVFDQSAGGSPVWVCDVEVGSNRFLKDVPIKAGSDGSRFYADIGQTVQLKQNALGRYQVIGPGDLLASALVIKYYSLTTGNETSSALQGFTFQKVAFEFYKGPTPPTAGTSLWSDGVTPFPFTRIVDANGNPA